MTDMTPEQLDQWRWAKVCRDVPLSRDLGYNTVAGGLNYLGPRLEEYRRLVREDVRPPAEPDQDTLDVRAVLEAWWAPSDSGDDWTEDGHTAEAKDAMVKIKARVRREAIQALPDQPSDEAILLFNKSARGTLMHTMEGQREIAAHYMAAIKQVYG